MLHKVFFDFISLLLESCASDIFLHELAYPGGMTVKLFKQGWTQKLKSEIAEFLGNRSVEDIKCGYFRRFRVVISNRV